jgi:hypothetical protein
MSVRGPRAEAFGRSVLGPVFAEFALRLHLLLLGLEHRDETQLLFCARGGLRLRLVYEAFLKAAGLTCPLPWADFMVSRLVAARTALAADSPEAYEELGREFRGERLGLVARALTQRDVLSGEEADAPFTPATLQRLLAEASPRGRALRAELAQQNRLFDAHLQAVSGGARRRLLCDTGLYGSTVRLLGAGRPDGGWSCALLARSNYKRFSESHFPLTVGLCVESNGYDPTEPRTSVLRYWHLIESTLEPDLPSVVRFDEDRGQVRASLEAPGWADRLQGQPGELFAGVMSYMETLPRRRTAEQIYADAPAAWRRLHDAIVWPSRQDREMLAAAPRSRDFGREDRREVIGKGLGARPRYISESLWREGAVVDQFPASRWIWLGALQAAHLGRSAIAFARRSRPTHVGPSQRTAA